MGPSTPVNCECLQPANLSLSPVTSHRMQGFYTLPLESTHLWNCNYDHLSSMVPLTWATVLALALTNLPDSNPLLSLPSKGTF